MADGSLLLIDDDPGTIQLLRSILHEYPTLRFATNGAAALRLAREAPPDLILLDAEMPGMDGFALCAELKRDEALAHIPVIFVTSHHDIEFETRALSLGAVDFIGKPLSAPRVLLRVSTQLTIKRQTDALREQAGTDALTGLANRRTFDRTLTSEMRRAQRWGVRLGLLMVDVDHFKRYNDAYGHPAGDAALRAVGNALREASHRDGDLSARFGGEEFAVILPGTGLEGATQIAQRINAGVAALALPHERSDTAACVTVSVGVSCLTPPGTQACGHPVSPLAPGCEGVLLSAADRALYIAKASGRNCVAVVDLEAEAAATPPVARCMA